MISDLSGSVVKTLRYYDALVEVPGSNPQEQITKMKIPTIILLNCVFYEFSLYSITLT